MIPTNPSAERLDDLVRGSLQRAADAIDPRPMFVRIFAELDAPARTIEPLVRVPLPRWSRPSYVSRQAWVLLAGLVLVVVLSMTPTSSALPRVEALVRDSQAVHRQPVDRCYLVEVRKEAGWPRPADEPPVKRTRLWTRGDQFWMESAEPNQAWKLGRDESGGWWLTWANRRGLRLDANEVPPWLQIFGDVNAMQLDTLLSDVLKHFELKRDAGPGGTTTILHATLRPKAWHPWLHRAILELDRETKVLRRVVLHRVRMGVPLATSTYTLIDTGTQPDANYRLEGHLFSPYEVFSRSHLPERRSEILNRVFNSVGRGPLVPRPGMEQEDKPTSTTSDVRGKQR